MRRLTHLALTLLLFIACKTFARESMAVANPKIVTFQSGDVTLSAYLFRPEGSGPFPVVIWNNGSPKPLLEAGPASRYADLGKFYASHGYVLMIPDRTERFLGFQDGDVDNSADQEAVSVEVNAVKERLEKSHADLRAAIDWVKRQSYADKDKVIMSGQTAGAIQALYEAARGSELRAFVLFSPGAMQWTKSPFMRELLTQNIKASKAPCFVLQAQNGFGLDAIATFGQILSAKGRPNRTMVYPPHGVTQKEGNLFAINGSKVWGDDVLKFLGEALKD